MQYACSMYLVPAHHYLLTPRSSHTKQYTNSIFSIHLHSIILYYPILLSNDDDDDDGDNDKFVQL